MASLIKVLQEVQPDEIYNLAAQSHVRISFDQPVYTTHSIATGTLNLLESIKTIFSSDRTLYTSNLFEPSKNECQKVGFLCDISFSL